MSVWAIELLMMSSVFFWATVKSALPTDRIWVAVSFRLAVSTPRAITAITPMATADAVRNARNGRAAMFRSMSPTNRMPLRTGQMWRRCPA